MRILERYILKNIVTLFLACLLGLMALYVVIDLITNLGDILKQQVTIPVLVGYYLGFLPVIFVQVAPFCCLVSVLFSFGNLNRSNEIIAMRASGLSIMQVTRQAVVFGFLISMIIFVVNDRLVPRANAHTQQVRDQMSSIHHNDKPQETVINLSMYGIGNRLFFVTKFSPAANSMEGITILEQDEHQNLSKKIIADRGEWKGGLWHFYRCITYNFDPNGQMKSELQFRDEEVMSIPESPKEFLAQRQKPEEMTIAQLSDYIGKLSRSGATGVVRKLKVDLYHRFAMPMTSTVIIFLAIPFSLIIRRRATGLASLGVSIIVGFLYYVANAVSIALGYAGLLPPILAATASHLAVLLVSFYLIRALP